MAAALIYQHASREADRAIAAHLDTPQMSLMGEAEETGTRA
ncbi:MAG TPA: hypothetical protein VK053_24275 [Jiangellaceae bacterium]|nr:hypothetical protein [Jiangellaceae bacterium]